MKNNMGGRGQKGKRDGRPVLCMAFGGCMPLSPDFDDTGFNSPDFDGPNFIKDTKVMLHGRYPVLLMGNGEVGSLLSS